VARLLHELVRELAALGLQLSTGPGKCEVVPTAGADSTATLGAFPPGFQLRTDRCFELLGASVGTEDFCHAHTQRRVQAAQELLDALRALESAQVALHLLRQCASFCRLSYSARVVPPSAHTAALQAMDDSVRACLEQLLGCAPSDASWHKLNKGGLGLRSAERHATAAYVASRAANAELCQKLYRVSTSTSQVFRPL
jgi:hypothetical protein